VAIAQGPFAGGRQHQEAPKLIVGRLGRCLVSLDFQTCLPVFP